MPKYFAKLCVYENQWAINLLVMDGTSITRHSNVIPATTSTVTDWNYDQMDRQLRFVINGKIESVKRINEIDGSVALNLLRQENFTKLAKGLSIQSPKTITWLAQKGIT